MTKSIDEIVSATREYAFRKCWSFSHAKLKWALFSPKCCGQKMQKVHIYTAESINKGCCEHLQEKYYHSKTIYVCKCSNCNNVEYTDNSDSYLYP